jgi:hypothetical protein
MRNRSHTSIAVAAAVLTAACTGPGAPVLDPVTVVASGASNPTVAVSTTGEAWIAWVATEGETSNVLVTTSRADGDLGSAVRANDIAGDAAPHEQAPAQVEVGPEGNVYVVWQNNTAAEGRMYPYSDLRFARSVDGGTTFEPAIFVNDDAGGQPASHTFHDIAVADDGTIYVSWIDGRVGAEYERRQAAAGVVADAHSGHSDLEKPGSEIRIAKSTDGGLTFSASHVVAGNACPCCRTALAVGSDGTVYLSWRTVLTGNVRDVVVARSEDAGASFSIANRVNQDDWVFDACPHAGSSLAVDDAGRVHVAWYTGADGRPGVYTAVSSDRGSTFGEARGVMTGEWVPPSQVKLAAAGDGRIALTWDDRRAGAAETAVAYIDSRGAAAATAATTFAGASPAIASAGGTTVVAWLDGEAVRFARSGRNDDRIVSR